MERAGWFVISFGAFVFSIGAVGFTVRSDIHEVLGYLIIGVGLIVMGTIVRDEGHRRSGRP